METLFFPLLILLIAVPMFLQARKQKRTMQEQQKLQDSLAVGDRVMTTSGLYGTVVDTGEDTVDLEIAPDVATTWLRQAIREKANQETEQNSDAHEANTVAAGSETAKSDSEAPAVAGSSQSGAQFAEPIEQHKTN